MSQHDSATIRKPRTDDRPLWDVLLAIEGYPAVLVAHELKLFALLADKPLSLEEICAAKHLARRPAHTLLAVATALGFLRLTDGRYMLVIWDRVEHNLATMVAGRAVGDLFPGDSVRFYERVPFRYHDVGEIERDLLAAGFTDIDIEPTRVYNVEDARAFLAGAGIDADTVAPQIEGRFISAFVRARKPS